MRVLEDPSFHYLVSRDRCSSMNGQMVNKPMDSSRHEKSMETSPYASRLASSRI